MRHTIQASRTFGKPFFYPCCGLLLLLGLIWGSGCQRKSTPRPTDAATPAATPTAPAAPVPLPAVDLTVPPTVVATLQRTACYGNCPVFTATVYSNGTARWQGVAHVPYQGNFRALLPADWLSALYLEAERTGFFTLHAQYPQHTRVIPDLPTSITFVQRNPSTRHRVENRGEAPLGLQRFEQYLERQLLALPWQREEGAHE